MKPFNLDDALSGKPVKLLGGSKAYVLGCIPDGIKTNYPIRGFIVEQNNTGELTVGNTVSWTLSGENHVDTKHFEDIIGMWEEEPIKYRHINGKKFPEPCSKAPKMGELYFIVSIGYGATVLKFRWTDNGHDNDFLNMGIIHTSKEAAQAHADAINTLYYGEPCSDQPYGNGLDYLKKKSLPEFVC